MALINRYLLILIQIGICGYSLAQTSTLSGGGVVKSNKGEVSYSVGQILIEPIFGSNHSIWPGIQQPAAMIITSISESDLPELQLHIYPNPASDWIKIHSEVEYHFEVSIYDVLGRSVLFKSLHDDQELHLESLSAGLYFLEINTMDRRLGVFQLIKK
ncbi:MAG: T9SS type A sorting domain-containing protein [Saprospiraceae bacterium]|nr:T9SS type A sorting domain-containing protein [Saprospiraceae bacterium]MCB9320033.1 T9SS type A sorting domain-containing protein [Lewinellaceae bacterium]